MQDICILCSDTAKKCVEDKNNLHAGENIADFAKVTNVMIYQGLI